MNRTDRKAAEATVAALRRVEVRGGRLEVRGPSRRSAVIDVGVEPVLVGREPSCQLVLDDTRVSSVHAELVATEQGVRVRDLGSRNGTWVGDVRIVEAYLGEPSTVYVGETEIVFEPTRPEPLALAESDTCGPLYGSSAPMRAVFDRIGRVGPTDLTALVQGETGTGKELVAQAIHQKSHRKDRPFVVVDCGAIAPTLAEAALFGHERGAYTGAVERRVSPFVEADGGTIFLDELGELPIDVQPKLLRALAERRIKPLGGNTYRPVDVRVVAATRRDLVRAVNEGTFRSDLYFRVAQVRIDVPPLRARIEDVPGLVRYFLLSHGQAGAYRRVSNETLERLMRYDWPGNVRELRNAVSVALALADAGGPVDVAAYIGLPVQAAPGEAHAAVMGRNFHVAKREALERFEREYFAGLVEATGGNISEIARRAGLERAHVRRYLRRHGLLAGSAPRPGG